MNLDNICNYFDKTEEDRKRELLDKIKTIQDRLSNKDKAIEELQYERDLIMGNLCYTINYDLKNSSFNIFMGFTDEMFWKAWRLYNHKEVVEEEFAKGEVDENYYKSHKTALSYTDSLIREKFFGKEFKDKVKLIELLKTWTTGYSYTYKYKKQEIMIFIPIFSADEKTYPEALYGYRVNFKRSEYGWDFIASDLDYKKVAEKLQDWIKNEGWKKKDEQSKND